MDFMSVGSINTYIKNMDMQIKWQQNQKTGNYKPAEKTEKYRSVDEWVSSQQNRADEEKEKENNQLNEIKKKYSYGKTLTQQELRYLQTRDPAAYARIQSAEAAGRIYECELRSCRTKDDVQRYKMAHVASSLSSVKSIMNDTSMSLEEKLEKITTERRKMSAVNKAENEFIRRGDYARLPSMAEKLKAERDMKRAKEEEARAAREKRAEKKERAAAAREKRKAEEERLEQLRQKKKAEREGKSVTKTKKPRLKKSRKRFRIKKPVFTTQQAANTYEARKVRAANARADYATSKSCPACSGSDTGKHLDVKA